MSMRTQRKEQIKREKTDKENRWENCPTCRGKGEVLTEKPKTVEADCLSCVGGTKVVECLACKGGGKFTTKRTKNIVTCRKCSGVGTVKIKCRECKGTEIVQVKLPAYFSTCRACSGTGRRLRFNPVVSRASLDALLTLREAL